MSTREISASVCSRSATLQRTQNVTTQSKLASSAGSRSPAAVRISIGTGAPAIRLAARFCTPSLGSMATTRSTADGKNGALRPVPKPTSSTRPRAEASSSLRRPLSSAVSIILSMKNGKTVRL